MGFLYRTTTGCELEMEIRQRSLLAPALVATTAAFFVFVLAARALAFAPLAVFAARRDVGARGALFEALIETDGCAGEIEGGAQAIFEEALITEMERLQLIREQDEGRRRGGGLRDVEDLHFAIRG